MIVECPRCNARYRVEQEILKDDPTFKCSRCSHIFAYDTEPGATPVESPPESAPAAPPAKPPARPRRDDASLSFAFATPASMPSPEAVASYVATSEARGEARHVDDTPEDAFAFGDDEEEAPREEEPPAPEPPDVDEPRFVRGEDELRVEETTASHPERVYFAFLALLALVFANLALYLRNHGDETERWLARLPVLGGLLTEDRLLQTKIQLQDLEGVYQQIKDDRTVFIVSGRALNTSEQPLKGVQIESGVYDEGGNPVETKVIYCGNAMSLKIVRDLSSKEISLLQRLEPPQRFEIQPGEAAAFTVVFMTPPPKLREFTARVVAAQPVVS